MVPPIQGIGLHQTQWNSWIRHLPSINSIIIIIIIISTSLVPNYIGVSAWILFCHSSISGAISSDRLHYFNFIHHNCWPFNLRYWNSLLKQKISAQLTVIAIGQRTSYRLPCLNKLSSFIKDFPVHGNDWKYPSTRYKEFLDSISPTYWKMTVYYS